VSRPDPAPWWATDPGAPDGHEPDPLEAHRAARRGADPGSGPAEDRSGAGADDEHRPDICGVCPVCLGARMLGETRPELLEHLTEAARHLAAALRAVVDPPSSPRGTDDPHGGDPGRVRRIDLD
jgi:hypothetical protein